MGHNVLQQGGWGGSGLEQQAAVSRTQLAPYCSVGQTPQHHQQQVVTVCRRLSRSCARKSAASCGSAPGQM